MFVDASDPALLEKPLYELPRLNPNSWTTTGVSDSSEIEKPL